MALKMETGGRGVLLALVTSLLFMAVQGYIFLYFVPLAVNAPGQIEDIHKVRVQRDGLADFFHVDTDNYPQGIRGCYEVSKVLYAYPWLLVVTLGGMLLILLIVSQRRRVFALAAIVGLMLLQTLLTMSWALEPLYNFVGATQ